MRHVEHRIFEGNEQQPDGTWRACYQAEVITTEISTERSPVLYSKYEALQWVPEEGAGAAPGTPTPQMDAYGRVLVAPITPGEWLRELWREYMKAPIPMVVVTEEERLEALQRAHPGPEIDKRRLLNELEGLISQGYDPKLGVQSDAVNLAARLKRMVLNGSFDRKV